MDAHEVTPAAKRSVLVRLWLGAFLAMLCVAHGNFENLDSAFTMQGARAFVRRGDSGLLQQKDGGDSIAEIAAAGYIAQNSGKAFGMTGKDGVHQYVWFPIGHLALMVPVVALGERIAAANPDIETRYHAHVGNDATYAEGQFVIQQGLVAMTLPALFGASTIVLLFLIAQALGASSRESLLCALAIGVCTQCVSLFHETLSDGPGLTFVLGALLAVVRALGNGPAPSWRAMVCGGLCAGAAVLTRYQHAFVVIALGAWLVVAALRPSAPRQLRARLVQFALGGAPMAIALFAANIARFGSPMTTGYPPPLSWFDTPPWIGLPKILFAAGKGILWLSPLLWLGFVAARRSASVPRFRALAWTLFAIPVLMFSCTNGWQSGQCWGVRYVTAGVVAFLALVLPQSRPWANSPRAFRFLCAVGLFCAVTSVVAPTRGHNQLAGQAVLAHYEEMHKKGMIDDADLASVRADQADKFFTMPRYSPLDANWRYAWLCATGGFEDENGNPRHGASGSVAPLFSHTSQDPARLLAPIHFEDRGFRWLWFVLWGELLSVPWWALLAPPLIAALLLLWSLPRALSKN